MGKVSYWQLLLDDRMSWWEMQKINQAFDEAATAQAAAESAQYRGYSMETRLDALSREVVMLRTALTMLTQTLKDTKVIDEQLLDARLEAAMEDAAAALPRQGHVPSVNAVLRQTAAQTGPAMLTCIRCRQSVPASTTLMTGDGPMCERCPT